MDTSKIIFKHPADIKVGSFAADIYFEDSNAGYAEMLLKTQLFEVTNLNVLSPSGYLISDPRPIKAAIESGITSVPCVVLYDTPALKRFQIAMGHSDEIMDKYKTLMQDMKKKDTAYGIILRKQILEEIYGIKKGGRADLDPVLKAAIVERNNIVSPTYCSLINKIITELKKVYGDDMEAIYDFLKSQKKTLSLKKLYVVARQHVAKNVDAKGKSLTNDLPKQPTAKTIELTSNTQLVSKLPVDTPPSKQMSQPQIAKPAIDASENTRVALTVPVQKIAQPTVSPLSAPKTKLSKNYKTYDPSKINILNFSCYDVHLLPDGINIVITSPPYFRFRPPQKGIDNSMELGLEPDPETYAETLAQYFLILKPKLARNAVIYINLGDKMIGGEFQLAPELFMTKMIEKGFVCKDKQWWVKAGQPGDGENSAQNVEYLLKFCVKGEDPIATYDWLLDDKRFEESVVGKDPLTVKMSSFVNLKNGFISTSNANTGKLRELCIKEGFFLDHTSTYLPELPYACLKTSALRNSIVYDPFSGCNNTAVACLWASELNLTYYGTELNEQSVKASWINIEKVHGYKPIEELNKAA